MQFIEWPFLQSGPFVLLLVRFPSRRNTARSFFLTTPFLTERNPVEALKEASGTKHLPSPSVGILLLNPTFLET